LIFDPRSSRRGRLDLLVRWRGDGGVLSEGKGPRLAKALGVAMSKDGAVQVDVNGRTSIDRLYTVGRSTRPGRSQAIISAGDGAAVAIDILSAEAGEPFCARLIPTCALRPDWRRRPGRRS